MDKLFEIIFLKEAFDLLQSLEPKHYNKILFNIRNAHAQHDAELFKKLRDEIW